MGASLDHLAKARANERFALGLDLARDSHRDWCAVALAYAALHYVEAYFAVIGIHSRNHQERDREIGRQTVTRPIYRAYKAIKAQSSHARYQVTHLNGLDVASVKRNLAIIRSRLEPHLS